MIRIITDSTSDISQKQAGNMGICVVPLTVNFGDRQYKDGVDISSGEFYERLAKAEVLPTTSQPSPDDFLPIFEDIREAGDSAVVISLSSKLSGTYQSAMIARQICKYDDIHIIDSSSAAIGLRLLVDEAIKMRASGMDAAGIAKALTDMVPRIVLYVMVDTLEYLYKGGRLSKTTKIAGSLLGFKPILTLQEGKLELHGTGRGARQTLIKLLDAAQITGEPAENAVLYFGYTHLDDSCNMLRKLAKEKYGEKPEIISPVGCAIGAHVGPGAAVMAYLSAKQ